MQRILCNYGGNWNGTEKKSSYSIKSIGRKQAMINRTHLKDLDNGGWKERIRRSQLVWLSKFMNG